MQESNFLRLYFEIKDWINRNEFSFLNTGNTLMLMYIYTHILGENGTRMKRDPFMFVI